jgi:hypothetical protein
VFKKILVLNRGRKRHRFPLGHQSRSARPNMASKCRLQLIILSSIPNRNLRTCAIRNWHTQLFPYYHLRLSGSNMQVLEGDFPGEWRRGQLKCCFSKFVHLCHISIGNVHLHLVYHHFPKRVPAYKIIVFLQGFSYDLNDTKCLEMLG